MQNKIASLMLARLSLLAADSGFLGGRRSVLCLIFRGTFLKKRCGADPSR